MSDFRIDAREVINNLKSMDKKVQAALNVIGNTTSENMKTYAQTNHPWTDRTHSATDNIKTGTKWEGTTLDMSITHGVDHGLWLETKIAFEGKYKILEEARDSQIEEFKKMILAMKL